MTSRFHLNGVAFVELRFAAFLEDDQGRGNTRCDVPGFSRSNGPVHRVIRQLRCRKRAPQLEQTHLVSRSKCSFTIFRNGHYRIIKHQNN